MDDLENLTVKKVDEIIQEFYKGLNKLEDFMGNLNEILRLSLMYKYKKLKKLINKEIIGYDPDRIFGFQTYRRLTYEIVLKNKIKTEYI